MLNDKCKMLNDKGQTLIELIIVVAVSVIIIGALVFAIIASLRNAQFSKNQSLATKLAQEGIERVRSGRDRNKCIDNLGDTVKSWNGNNSSCPGGSIWNYQIYNGCGSGGTACYFKFISNTDGDLSYLTSSSTFPSGVEDIYGNGQFKRAIVLNDDSDTYTTQKTVTALVQWTDFSGPHQSKLSTILRKL